MASPTKTPQTWNVLNQSALTKLETVSREPLDNLFDVLDSKVNFPFLVTLSGSTINIAESEIRIKKSDGSGNTTNSYVVATAPISNSYLVFAASSLNLSSGATTGDFGTVTSPVMTANYYNWLGIEARDDAQLHVVWGIQDAALPKYPVFSEGATAIALLLVQANPSGGTWSFLTPLQTNLIMFKGSGGGSGGAQTAQGADLATIAYYARAFDTFSDPDLIDTSYTTGAHDTTNRQVSLSYDASKTLSVVGNVVTLSGTPSYTIAVGDIVTTDFVEHTRISALTSQTIFTVEDGTVLSNGAGLVSQVLQLKELTTNYGDVTAKTRVVDQFDLTSELIDETVVTYLDSSIEYPTATPDIAFSACSNSTLTSPANWSNQSIRQDGLSETENYVVIPNAGNKMYVRYFANKTSGSGIVSIEETAVYFLKRVDVGNRVSGWAAAKWNNGLGSWSTIGSNSPVISTIGGKTRWNLGFSYDRFSNKNGVKTHLFVVKDGLEIFQQVLPDYSGNFCYTPVDNYTIDFNTDLSLLATDVKVYAYLMDSVSFDFSELSNRIGVIETLDMSWVPYQNNTWNLGSPSKYWNNLYLNNLYLNNATSNIIPDTTLTKDLGSGTKYWNNLYLNNLYLNYAASNIIPDTTGTKDLGSSSKTWKDIYISNSGKMYFGTGIIKFDTVSSTIQFANDGSTFESIPRHAVSTEYDNGNSGSINWNNGVSQKITLNSASTAITFSNSINGRTYVIKLVQDGVGGRLVTWPVAVKWPNSLTPSLSLAASKTDLAMIYYDGTSYFGNIITGY